jgi:N-acetylmuramoyl-L-alanine amidase-like protein
MSRAPTIALLAAAGLLAACGDTEEKKPVATPPPKREPSVELGGPGTKIPPPKGTTQTTETTSKRSEDTGPEGGPGVKRWFIPFPAKRKREMAAYSRRHYGIRSYRLDHPKVIVQHYSETNTAREAYDLFKTERPDPELRELPNVCVHYIVDKEGKIFQLVPLDLMCRHTVGLNYTSIGIEHVGRSDAEVLGNRKQVVSSLALTTFLRCRFHIAMENVIGHNESLSSQFHRERVASLRKQTHEDFRHVSMERYREALAKAHCKDA